MRNAEIAREFTKGATEGKGSNMFIDKNIIYSYGNHFPMAIRLNSEEGYRYIVNSAKYSHSTSKHQSYLNRCLNEKEILLEVCNLEIYKEMKNVRELTKINFEIENNLKVINDIGLNDGYMLRLKKDFLRNGYVYAKKGTVFTIKHIHSYYGWITFKETEQLPQGAKDIMDLFEIAHKEMIVRSL